jgi:hypothetical protein
MSWLRTYPPAPSLKGGGADLWPLICGTQYLPQINGVEWMLWGINGCVLIGKGRRR